MSEEETGAKGSVTIIGLGPGDPRLLTESARIALDRAQDLIGYIPYVARVPEREGLVRHASDNRVEVDRARHALELAMSGRRVAVVSGGDPGVFAMAAAVFELTGGNVSAALSQLSGEVGTGSQQVGFNALTQFMGVLSDPIGHGGGFGGAGPATGYAEEGEQASAYASRRTSDAFAMFTKAAPASYVPRWNVWASGFGGGQSISGNAGLGTSDTTSRIAGAAVGADYRFSPNTIAGFALAGGGSSFGVSNLSSGRSDLFQAGAYARHTIGAAYVTGALAYGWQDVTTTRNVTIAGLDVLRARFNANALSGRLEGGYRFVAPVAGGLGVTPYAAGQFTTLWLPSYAEQAVTGNNTFALAYGAQTVTDTRSELGIRTDKSWALPGAVLTLRGREAWMHDYNPNRSIGATFTALPGASFVVNGATQPRDAWLSTLAADVTFVSGWSLAATLDSEWAQHATTYTGKGTVRYQW